MIASALILASLAAVTCASSSGRYMPKRQSSDNAPDTAPAVAPATYDGKCFYPKPTDDFVLNAYLGRWYQIAGTATPTTAGCTCTFAEYALNENGTVNVQNYCERNGTKVHIEGIATPVSPDAGYGRVGALRVLFPPRPPPYCPGPNYIVQDIGVIAEEDSEGHLIVDNANAFAIVQTHNFTTLYLISRNQRPSNASIESWLKRAGQLGSNLDEVLRIDQSNCQFT